MTESRALITGASAGLGTEFARQLAKQGSHLAPMKDGCNDVGHAHPVGRPSVPASRRQRNMELQRRSSSARPSMSACQPG